VPPIFAGYTFIFETALTLRRTLLLVLVLLGLLPSAALSWLSFVRTREAMTHQIQQSLSIQARAIQSDIDKGLFERFENAQVWRRSELMEDLRVGDVDKRVTNYLVGLQAGYDDVYDSLDCIDQHGRILASSVPSRINKIMNHEEDGSLSISTRLGGDGATLSLPRSQTLGDRSPFVIRTRIPSSYPATPGGPDEMVLSLDVAPINRLLDAAALDKRAIAVVDAQGRWVAASSQLRGRRLPDAAGRSRTRGLEGSTFSGVVQSSPWLDFPALGGSAASLATPSFAGSGWTTLVFEPVDAALAPVWRMAMVFAGLFAVVLAATLIAATWIASAMSRPIRALTERTRRYQAGLGAGTDAVPGSGISELDILARAYDELIRSLEQSKRELVRTSKMAMLGELGAVLAHEVRTPLGILRSSAQILKRNPGLGPEGLELMGFIESETERLNKLVSTLLDTARPPRPQLDECDLHELLAKCVQMHDLKQGVGIRQPSITVELKASNAVTFADAEQLKQVFFNLLSNAAEAAGADGRVAISTRDLGPRVCIDCEDSGSGVSPELEKDIFEPFVSRRAGGFGLGLAVVRQIVSAHHGTIHVGKSRWGGAMFTVCLPFVHGRTGVVQ
jgi:two-component system sensor histidine kinase HydH